MASHVVCVGHPFSVFMFVLECAAVKNNYRLFLKSNYFNF